MTIVFCTMARHIAPSFHTPVPTLGDLSSHDLAWRWLSTSKPPTLTLTRRRTPRSDHAMIAEIAAAALGALCRAGLCRGGLCMWGTRPTPHWETFGVMSELGGG